MKREVNERLRQTEVLLQVARERLTECYDLGANQDEANTIEFCETVLKGLLVSLSKIR